MALRVDYVAKEMATNLRRNLTLTFATMVTISLTLAFAVLLQCERGVLVLATLNGGVAWTVYGVLHQQAHGNQVYIVTLTTGNVGTQDPSLSRMQLAEIRRKEELAALSELGIPGDHYINLGYDDGLLEFEDRKAVVENLVNVAKFCEARRASHDKGVATRFGRFAPAILRVV